MTEDLLLYLQIARPQAVRFGNPFSNHTGIEGMTVFELDNHSQEAMLGYARTLLSEAKRLFVFVELADAGESMGVIRPVLSLLLKERGHTEVVVQGSHPMADKMLAPLTPRKIDNRDELTRLVGEWL